MCYSYALCVTVMSCVLQLCPVCYSYAMCVTVTPCVLQLPLCVTVVSMLQLQEEEAQRRKLEEFDRAQEEIRRQQADLERQREQVMREKEELERQKQIEMKVG